MPLKVTVTVVLVDATALMPEVPDTAPALHAAGNVGSAAVRMYTQLTAEPV